MEKGKERSKIISSNIRRYIKEAGITQKELADSIEISPSTLSDYLNLRSNPSHGVIQKIADYFNIKKSDIDTTYKEEDGLYTIYNKLNLDNQKEVYNFAEEKLEEQNQTQTVITLGKTAAGEPIEQGDIIEEEKEVSSVPEEADVALVVQGDSMEPEYKNGSVVFYKRQPQVENGELAVVHIKDDGITFKKILYDYDNKKIILRSLNNKYEDKTFNANEITILGKVIT